jgi:HEAT repeat protein
MVGWVAASSLGVIGDASAVPGLLIALKIKKNPVRAPIIRCLGKIGDSTAIPGLCRALLDRERSVRKAARVALAQIRK